MFELDMRKLSLVVKVHPGSFIKKKEVYNMTKNVLPKASISRIFKNAGGERLSAEARNLILDDVESYATSLIKASMSASRHAGRKTVMPEDVSFGKILM